ncbi:translation initiation factor eIF-2B epsilon subunit, GEF [Lithohypha guttulata]|nr:translation initiation factor eIF-2B epsilon subunit, GEF [Lithohypha guttulata]
MPPKQTKVAGRTKEDTKEDPLQAVVVADTFESKFAPFSTERPRCLIPLANAPLIEYTLEYLASAGVQDVFFYAGAHIEQVETYLNASRWMSKSSPLKIILLRCMATSVGDVMRDIDQKRLIQGDFICVSGDIISDFPISKALRVHKQRREKDKDAIMTILVRERNQSDHRHKDQIVPTFVIDPTKDRILHYEESFAGTAFGTHVDPEILKTPELDVRQDLVDCRIDIGTPDMLSLWSDNFDNQHPRKDFLYGVLKDYELNGKTIHTYVVDEHYAHRVDSPAAYAAITYDLQHGIASSLALSNNIAGTRFQRSRKNILKEDDVIIQRPTRLDHGTIVGSGTSIGASTSIRKTIVGRRCQIGKRANIDSAFIWDDVTIGSDVKISRAIVGSETFIGDKCVIEDGALISFGSRIPAGSHIPPGERVTSTSSFNKDGTLAKDPAADAFESDEDEPTYESQWARPFYGQQEFAESTFSLDSDASEPSDEISKDGSRSASFVTHGSEEDTSERFVHDTAAILVQRMQEDRNSDDMQSELMGLRFSGGADGGQVQKAVAIALSRHIHSEVDNGASADKATRKTLEQYRNLVRRPNAEQTIEEQVVFLLEAQLDLSRRTDGARIMPFFVKDLYDLEVFEEEAFTKWFDDERSKEDNVAATRAAAEPFIDWLAATDEEESEEEEEDDDGEED